jgi:hypothetical protein
VGASALIVISLLIWKWHFPPQMEVTEQKKNVAIEASPPKRRSSADSNGSASRLPAPEPGVVSNPFGSSFRNANNPFAAGPSEGTSNNSVEAIEPRPKRYNSLPTGSRLSDDIGIGGHGKLSVSNRTNLDAVVRLYNRSTLETVRWFFVKADSSCTMTAIPEGDYVLAYASGLDWDDSDDVFRWNPSYHEFEAGVSFTEQSDTDRIRYQEFSVTLHPVVGGNARAKSISRSDFLKGHRH